MKYSKLKFTLVLTLLVVGLGLYIYDGFTKAPSRIRANYRTIESEKIHQDLDGLQVAYLSDLHYLSFFDEKRLNTVVEKMNAVNPDVIIFGGDLIDQQLSDEQYTHLLSSLRSMNAKYGKFAILGEADYKSETINEQVESLLYEADFEIIKNSVIKLTKDSQQAIQLVGIDSPIDGFDEIETTYELVDDKLFTITIVHTPDTATKLLTKKTDLILAGHSHGGQVNIPLLGQVYNQTLAEQYYSGLYLVNESSLYVSNGVGTVTKDVRINAPAEIIVYTLRAK